MPEIELNVSAVKCPICDFNHNYKIRIEYEEGSGEGESQPKYYNKFLTKIRDGGKVIDVPVYEIDAFCTRNNIPFRITVEPKIPIDSNPTKFVVTSVV